MNRAVMLRIAACGIIGLGAALLIAALLLSTYTSSRITKIPLDIDATLVSDGTGTALDPASLYRAEVRRQPERAAGVRSSRSASSRPPTPTSSRCRSATRCGAPTSRRTAGCCWRSSTPSRSTARPRWRFRTTPTPAARCRSRAAFNDENPPTNIALPHDGLSYRFPFHTEKKTYPYFDPIAQKAFDANYDGEEDVNGLTTYRFTQNVGYDADGKLVDPVKYPSLYANDEDGKVTAARGDVGPASGDPDEQITMTRYYAAQRTFWVDPVSGTIVKQSEHANHYYARDALKPEVTLADYKVTSNEETVESQVNAARDERDRLALWSRVLPITFTAVGLIALIGGLLLGSFSLRTESALIDPGLDAADHGSSAAASRGRTGARRRSRDREAAHAAQGRQARPADRRVREARRTPAPPDGRSRSGACGRCPARILPCVPVPGTRWRWRCWWSAPLLAPGYLLLRDAVSTPRSYLSDTALGLTSAPRAHAAGLRGGAGLPCCRRRRRGEGAAGRSGCGWPAGVQPGSSRWCCPMPVPAASSSAITRGDLESLCRRTAAAGPLEPAGRLRLPALGGDGDADAAVDRQ